MAEFELHRAGNSQAQQKEALSRLFAQSGNLAATGVLDGLVVSQAATANGTVLIAVGSAVIHPSMTAGASLLMNDTIKTLDVFTANPVGGLPRNDVVVFDSVTATLAVIVGTPNAAPTDPTVPNTAIALARLSHLAGAVAISTARITDLRVFTSLRGTPTIPAVSSSTVTNSAAISTVETTLLTLPAITGDGAAKVTLQFSWYAFTQTVTTDKFALRIYDAATLIATCLLVGPDDASRAGGTFVAGPVTPTVGSHTYTVRIQRLSGTGTSALSAGATYPATFSLRQFI